MKRYVLPIAAVLALAAPAAAQADQWLPHLFTPKYRTTNQEQTVRRENRAFTLGYTTGPAFRRYELRHHYDLEDGQRWNNRLYRHHHWRHHHRHYD